MNIFWPILIFCSLMGCASNSSNPVPIDPGAVIQKNYDYSAPADIDRQSKPVWILPLMNQGWVPARIDPQSGDWMGGHYQATIIQEGHWATLEEAEQSGRPYVRSGEGQPTIPPLSTPGSTQGGVELDLAHIESRLSQVEQGQKTLLVEQTEGVDKANSVRLSSQKPATVERIEMANQRKLMVRYRENDEVEIHYGSKQYIQKLPHPNAILRITVPEGDPEVQ